MTKYLISIYFSLAISSSYAFCQTVHDSLFVIQAAKKVVFITNDSCYRFTKIIQQDGVFKFIDSYNDSANYCVNREYLSHFPNKTTYTKVSYTYLPGVDTIFNYFSGCLSNGFNRDMNNIHQELKYSYILTQLGEPKLIDNKDSICRIIWPCEEFNFCSTYKVARFDISEKKILLYTVTGISDDIEGILPVNRKVNELIYSDIKKIRKVLDRSINLSNDCCLELNDGNAWVIELLSDSKYSVAILSNLCLRSRSKNSPFAMICRKLNIIAGKYVPYNCLKPNNVFEFY